MSDGFHFTRGYLWNVFGGSIVLTVLALLCSYEQSVLGLIERYIVLGAVICGSLDHLVSAAK